MIPYKIIYDSRSFIRYYNLRKTQHKCIQNIYFNRKCSCCLFVLHPYLLLCLDCPAFCHFVFAHNTTQHNTTQHNTTQTSMPLAVFKPAISASYRPQILALDRSDTGFGRIQSPDLVAVLTALPQGDYRRTLHDFRMSSYLPHTSWVCGMRLLRTHRR
jgi:hypothetical protein